MRTKISADEARHLRQHLLSTATDGRAELVKTTSAPASWDAATRSARFVLTKQVHDRAGDLVMIDGIDMMEFLRNPVALLAHASSAFPIGQWQDVKKYMHGAPPLVEGDLKLHPAGGPIVEIDQVAWLLAQGGLKGASIGFLPDWSAVEKVVNDGSWTGGLIFHRSELLEVSVVNLPANPAALAKRFGGKPNDAAESRIMVDRRKAQLEREARIARLKGD
jgi:phage head maturation protease